MGVRIHKIIDFLESHFPLHIAAKWDNSGLLIGSAYQEANKVVVALDLDGQILREAVKDGADLIITHHPFLFQPVKKIIFDEPQGFILQQMILHGIALYSAHTNLDAADMGTSQQLAEKIGLEEIALLSPDIKKTFYKLVVFVPPEALERVREAISLAGAGHVGNYADTFFQSPGVGTFTPAPGTRPYIGKPLVLQKADEYRLETIVPQFLLSRVLEVMLSAHPYEEAAYDIYKLENNLGAYSWGRKGIVNPPVILQDLAEKIKQDFHLEGIKVVGDLNRRVQKVAVIPGSGASFIQQVKSLGMDLLITGDIKYHEAKEAQALGLALIDPGHQSSEEMVLDHLKNLLTEWSQEFCYPLEVKTVYAEPCIKII